MSKPKFKTHYFYTGWGKSEEVKKTGILGMKTKTVEVANPRIANYDEFSRLLEETYNDFDKEGYDVINVLPLAIGTDEQVEARLKSTGESNYLGQVSFSITRGAVVVGKLRTV